MENAFRGKDGLVFRGLAFTAVVGAYVLDLNAIGRSVPVAPLPKTQKEPTKQSLPPLLKLRKTSSFPTEKSKGIFLPNHIDDGKVWVRKGGFFLSVDRESIGPITF
jgi:hypothetical protein